MYWTTLEISAPRCALMCYPSSNITYCIACLLCIGVILLNTFNSIQYRKFSFSQRTINVWNNLSTDCVHASSVMFKNKIDEYLVKAGYT